MNTLRKHLTNYLAMRRGLGFPLKRDGKALHNFVSFLEEKESDYVTTACALEWAQLPPNAQPATWAGRLRYVRGFARYMKAIEPRTEIPANELLPHNPKRTKPYLYTEEEIQMLMRAALDLPICPNWPEASLLKRETYYALIGLLAVTGMRIGEATSLRMKHVDLQTGVLTIEEAKGGKARLVPLHDSTTSALCRYKAMRSQYQSSGTEDYFFINREGNCLDHGTVRRTFYILSRTFGLRGNDASKGPRIHDLRHRFAVLTLLRWYQNGQDAQRLLPILSTYLGHVHVNDTYWYLTAHPELMACAVERLERRWEGE